MRGLSGVVHVQIHEFLKDRAPSEPPYLAYSWCSVLAGEQWGWGWGRDRTLRTSVTHSPNLGGSFRPQQVWVPHRYWQEKRTCPDAVSSHDSEFHPTQMAPKEAEVLGSWL